jgi:hypothetical protein
MKCFRHIYVDQHPADQAHVPCPQAAQLSVLSAQNKKRQAQKLEQHKQYSHHNQNFPDRAGKQVGNPAWHACDYGKYMQPVPVGKSSGIPCGYMDCQNRQCDRCHADCFWFKGNVSFSVCLCAKFYRFFMFVFVYICRFCVYLCFHIVFLLHKKIVPYFLNTVHVIIFHY